MTNKIYSIIQDTDLQIDSYLHYVARLAKDFDITLELIDPPLIKNDVIGDTIIGSGIPNIVRAENPKIGRNVIHEKLSSEQFQSLNYTVSETFLDNLLAENKTEESILWTINQASNDSWLNGVFGTIETDLYEKIDIPSLTIPNDCVYKKPEKLLLMIRDRPSLNFKKFNQLINRLNIDLVYVFEEDESSISTESIMDTLNLELKEFKGKTIAISNQSEDQVNTLDNILEKEKPEWIAFANYNRSFLERFYKTNTKQLTLSSNIPVLNF